MYALHKFRGRYLLLTPYLLPLRTEVMLIVKKSRYKAFKDRKILFIISFQRSIIKEPKF